MGQKTVKLAVIGKTKNDSFYVQSFNGCLEYAKTAADIECIYDGPDNYQDIRSQAAAISRVLDKNIDGVMISITDSQYLSKTILPLLAKRNIPVITFDSDLLPEHRQYRLAYVGTNNFDFGIALGKYASQYKKQGENQLCLYSGHSSTPNLNERIKGVRHYLSGGKSTEKLNGENNWFESARCPYYSLGKRRQALVQVVNSFNTDIPINIAVAGFAQFSPKYIETILPFKQRIASQDIVFISADTEPLQLDALKQGLSTANIGQKPFAMGRLAAELIYKYTRDKQTPAKEYYFLGYHYCTISNADTCTTTSETDKPSQVTISEKAHLKQHETP